MIIAKVQVSDAADLLNDGGRDAEIHNRLSEDMSGKVQLNIGRFLSCSAG